MANNFIQITYNNIKNEVEYFLKKEHNKGKLLFSKASPFGQILSVMENMMQLSMLYLKNTIQLLDINNVNTTNDRVIMNTAIAAGHNPSRAISATGTLKLVLKSNVDLMKEIPGGRITVLNRTKIKNNTNGLSYLLNIGSDRISHIITPNYQFFLPIIQGEWVTNTRTGDGNELLTFNFSEGTNKDVENFNVEVLVNNEYWQVKKHLWDMIPEEKACVVRSGFNGGIDVVFGNGGFGAIPEIGSIINVNYIRTDGADGNIYRRTRNDFKFVDDVFDGNGEIIDLNKVFDIEIYTDINFGANKESIIFTRNILPIASNNFVLGTPQQYAYEIKKLGIFSHVNAYEKTGTIFIVATPNIKLFKSNDSNYFKIDLRAFYLDNYEKSKIDLYLRSGGNLQLTKKYRIKSPDLSFYTMNIHVISYSDAIEESVTAQILDKISEYFLNLNRIDRIPKLDIIKELSTISDIHSVDVQFVCKKNEDYHRVAMINSSNKKSQYDTNYNTDISVNVDYDDTNMIGLDPILGDIIFEPNEIPIIRGGWFDRNELYYSDNIDGNGLKSVNIITTGKIDSKNKVKI
ncbi:MAG: hypothetical protein M0R46_10480 [Candidatus Muirbacterium halophilum]|nr:hypothetical protein [Candidatus Muirbacterium halophilum]